MNQAQRRLFLIQSLLKEKTEYRDMRIPAEPGSQRQLLRGLMNIRAPRHTVGPIISGRVTKADKELLASCYRSCLELAAENELESVAFCCISTGEFHFSNEQAAEIAVRTVKEFYKKQSSVKKVIFNVFKDLDKEIYARLLGAD